MKRSKTQLWRSLAAAMLLGTAFASCSQDEVQQTGGTPLPEGEYPLTLIAGGLEGMAVPANASAPSTRGTVDNNWNGVENIALQVNNGEVKVYTAKSENGEKTAKLTSSNPFYWQSTGEEKVITAWHPYNDTYPEPWTVKSDQSTVEGYQASDLIKGELTLSFANKDTPDKNQITFYHQTAKIVVNLKADDGVTFDENTSVQLINLNSKGIKDGGNTISTYRPDANNQTYLALLAPQDIKADQKFIKVTINGKDFHYTTTANKTLDMGVVYTYRITVKANGIEVTETTGGSWSDSNDSENIISSIHYTANDVKKGDYIYKDGSISDGGLRVINPDGTVEREDKKPEEDEEDNPVVGIVFWTPSETSTAGRVTPASLTDDKIMHTQYPKCINGLAVAVKKVTYDSEENMAWQNPYEHVKSWQERSEFNSNNGYVSIASGTEAPDNVNRIYGFQNTVILRAYNADCQTNNKEDYIVLPVAALDEFEEGCPAPAKSTGWFIPSAKELHMLCYKDVDDVYNTWGDDKTATRDLVNLSLKAADGNVLGTDDIYWSSSESKKYNDSAFRMYFNGPNMNLTDKDLTNNGVRAVCAF